jgi:hypothetical protein
MADFSLTAPAARHCSPAAPPLPAVALTPACRHIVMYLHEHIHPEVRKEGL